jgi:hypothetical protein
MAARNKELEEQLAVITKRKTRKRKRLQHGGTLEYGEAADQVAASASLPAKAPKKARGGAAAAQGATATQRRCGNCGGTGHNVRTCQADAAEDSESSASTQFILSDSGDDNNDD